MAEEEKKKTKKAAPKKKPAVHRAAKKPKVKEEVKIEAKVAAKAEMPTAVPPVHHAPPAHHVARKPKAPKVKLERFYGTGRRKEAKAKVWISRGEGKIMVNERPYEAYFCNRPVLLNIVNKPLVLLEGGIKFDINAEVFGGGVPSQADAIRMGIARAVVLALPEKHQQFRTLGLLTRDPREKERKKYGLKRARRAFQYTKR
jgi:small subunit ribosomal protein S9